MKTSHTSKIVTRCQICDNTKLEPILFLGYLPPVNQLRPIGQPPQEQPSYPAQLLHCPQCGLAQLGLIVNPKILFPAEYPYTSSTTKVLRDNFADLYKESCDIVGLEGSDLIVDIGSNDGNLLSNFKSYHILGITPEDIGNLAVARGIPTIQAYFNREVANEVVRSRGKAKIVMATNVFAHIDNVNEVLESIMIMLKRDGVFISESHYLLSLLTDLQFDTIYHEHLRFYSLRSLQYLFNKHGLEIIHVTRIPTHGGSIRVYAARNGGYIPDETVSEMIEREAEDLSTEAFKNFAENVVLSKMKLHSALLDIKIRGELIYGISAPSRASTLINYTGIGDLLDCVCEVQGSHKIGHYVPGTMVPIVDESKLFEDQPEYALILSWHIADELKNNLRKKGYKGKFIVPLPIPLIE